MFKRVEKHRLKKEEEEILGIDDEIMGLNDTDSEESTSESGLSDNEENVAGSMESDDSENSSGVENKDDPLLSVDQALHDPIYVVSVYPEVKACIVCPGKHLKGQKMTQLHRTSNACTIFFASYEIKTVNRFPSFLITRHMTGDLSSSRRLLQTPSLLRVLGRSSDAKLTRVRDHP